MPKMSDPAAQPPIRGLLIGDSGTGKTGGLASLALAGYRLFIADFDNGMEVLRNLIREADPKALDRVEFETFRDEHQVNGAFTVPKTARAWADGIKWLEGVLNQKDLGPQDVVCIDSLSFAARAAMNFILKLNGRLQSAPWISDWGEAQRLVENLVAMITDDAIKCHLLCSAHIATTGGKKIETIKNKDGSTEKVVLDEGPVKRLPSMIGKAFNPIVPRYFNHMLLFTRQGTGSAMRRSIMTRPEADLELKNTNPARIRPEYSLANGLAEYFAAARGA